MQHSWQSQDKVVRSLGAGVISACLFLLFTRHLPLLVPCCMLPLFYSGLRDGINNTGLAILFSVIIILCSNNAYAVIIFCIFFSVPVLHICHKATQCFTQNFDTHSNYFIADRTQEFLKNKQLKLPAYFSRASIYEQDDHSKNWYSYGHLISVMAQISLVITTLFAVVVSKTSHQAILVDIYKNVLTFYKSYPVAPQLTFENFVILYRLIPGFIGVFFFLAYVATTLIVQLILIYTKHNIRPAFNLVDFKLPLWHWIILCVGIMFCLILRTSFLNLLSINVVLVLLAVFMLQGISIIYIFCQREPYAILCVIGFCFVMLFLPWMIIFVVSIGVLEPWLGWRQKMKKDIRS